MAKPKTEFQEGGEAKILKATNRQDGSTDFEVELANGEKRVYRVNRVGKEAEAMALGMARSEGKP